MCNRILSMAFAPLQEDRHRDQLTAIRAKEDAQTADIPSLIKDRNDQQ